MKGRPMTPTRDQLERWQKYAEAHHVLSARIEGNALVIESACAFDADRTILDHCDTWGDVRRCLGY